MPVPLLDQDPNRYVPEFMRCRCQPLGCIPSGEEPSDFDSTGCPVHVMPEVPDDFEDNGEPF